MKPATHILLGEPVAITLNRIDGKSTFAIPADGWFQIAKTGRVVKTLAQPDKSEVQITQVIDETDLDRIVSKFRGELLVDYDHFSCDDDKSTKAAAWITALERRGSELWAQMRLSNSGRAALEGGDYRYFSPVLGFPPKNYRKGEEAHPQLLLCGAITNQPTFKGMVPLSNRQGDPLAQTHTQTQNMDYKKILLKLLGLAETATDAEIDAALPKTEQLITDGEALPETQNRLKAFEDAETKTLLDERKLTGEARAKWEAALTKNRAETIGLLKASVPVAEQKEDTPSYSRTHNRGAASVPATQNRGTEDAATLDRKRDAAVRAYMTKNRCSFQDAWDAARLENPELFTEAKDE